MRLMKYGQNDHELCHTCFQSKISNYYAPNHLDVPLYTDLELDQAVSEILFHLDLALLNIFPMLPFKLLNALPNHLDVLLNTDLELLDDVSEILFQYLRALPNMLDRFPLALPDVLPNQVLQNQNVLRLTSNRTTIDPQCLPALF